LPLWRDTAPTHGGLLPEVTPPCLEADGRVFDRDYGNRRGTSAFGSPASQRRPNALCTPGQIKSRPSPLTAQWRRSRRRPRRLRKARLELSRADELAAAGKALSDPTRLMLAAALRDGGGTLRV
jgi:hypothetical protein